MFTALPHFSPTSGSSKTERGAQEALNNLQIAWLAGSFTIWQCRALCPKPQSMLWSSNSDLVSSCPHTSLLGLFGHWRQLSPGKAERDQLLPALWSGQMWWAISGVIETSSENSGFCSDPFWEWCLVLSPISCGAPYLVSLEDSNLILVIYFWKSLLLVCIWPL